MLKLNADKKVCGRFKAEQLIPPAGSREPRKAVRHRLFFAALFLVFGGMLFTSCASTANNNHELMGDVAYVPDSTEIIQQKDITKTLVIDSTKKTGQIKPKCKKPVVVEEETKFLMGDVAYDPNDTIR